MDHVTTEEKEKEPDYDAEAKDLRLEARERRRRFMDVQLDAYYEAERRRLGHYPS